MNIAGNKGMNIDLYSAIVVTILGNYLVLYQGLSMCTYMVGGGMKERQTRGTKNAPLWL